MSDEPDDAAARALERARAYGAQENARRDALGRAYLGDARAALGQARGRRWGRFLGLSGLLGALAWPFMHGRGKE